MRLDVECPCEPTARPRAQSDLEPQQMTIEPRHVAGALEAAFAPPELSAGMTMSCASLPFDPLRLRLTAA